MQIFLAYLKFFYYLCSEIQKLIKMKKILFIIMAALTMVGCNSNEPKNNLAHINIVNPTKWSRNIVITDLKSNKDIVDEYVLANTEKTFDVAPGKYNVMVGENYDFFEIRSEPYKYQRDYEVTLSDNQTYRIVIDKR